MFGAFDAAVLRIGIAGVLTGPLLLAMDWFLDIPFDLILALMSSSSFLVVIGAYGCYKSRKDGGEGKLPAVPPDGKEL